MPRRVRFQFLGPLLQHVLAPRRRGSSTCFTLGARKGKSCPGFVHVPGRAWSRSSRALGTNWTFGRPAGRLSRPRGTGAVHQAATSGPLEGRFPRAVTEAHGFPDRARIGHLRAGPFRALGLRSPASIVRPCPCPTGAEDRPHAGGVVGDEPIERPPERCEDEVRWGLWKDVRRARVRRGDVRARGRWPRRSRTRTARSGRDAGPFAAPCERPS